MSETKKEAVSHQPDEVQQLMELLDSHGKTIGLTLALSCAVVLACVYYVNNQKKARAQASALFMAAGSVEQLQSITSKYPSTDTAPLALLRLAGVQFSQMNYSGALESYDQFTKKHSKHDLVNAAVMGQYHCIEALGRTTEALQGFEAFEAEFPEHFLTQEAILGKARCMEQLNRLQDAKAVYEQFITDYPENANTMRANQRLDVVNHIIETGGSTPAPKQVPVTSFNLDSFPLVTPQENTAAPAGNTE